MRPLWERAVCANIAFRIGKGIEAMRAAAYITRDLDRRYKLSRFYPEGAATEDELDAAESPELVAFWLEFWVSIGVPRSGKTPEGGAEKQARRELRALRDKAEAAWLTLPPAEQTAAAQLAKDALPMERTEKWVEGGWGKLTPGMGCEECYP